MQLSVDIQTDGDLGILVAKGEVDMATAGLVRRAITDLVAKGLAHLVLDMSDVTFIDSTGLGVLVGGRKKVEQLQGSLTLVCANPRILRLFKITGLDQAMAIHETMDEARASVRPKNQRPSGLTDPTPSGDDPAGSVVV
jgi:anti-sigma B factor antagonist